MFQLNHLELLLFLSLLLSELLVVVSLLLEPPGQVLVLVPLPPTLLRPLRGVQLALQLR